MAKNGKTETKVTQEQSQGSKLWDNIRHNVTAMCELRGITEQQLCEQMGVSRNYFGKGRTDVSLTRVLQLAKLLGMDEPQRLWDGSYADTIRVQIIDEQIKRLTEEREAITSLGEIMTPPSDWED